MEIAILHIQSTQNLILAVGQDRKAELPTGLLCLFIPSGGPSETLPYYSTS